MPPIRNLQSSVTSTARDVSDIVAIRRAVIDPSVVKAFWHITPPDDSNPTRYTIHATFRYNNHLRTIGVSQNELCGNITAHRSELDLNSVRPYISLKTIQSVATQQPYKILHFHIPTADGMMRLLNGDQQQYRVSTTQAPSGSITFGYHIEDGEVQLMWVYRHREGL